jgi:TolA-binding protein
MPRREDIERFAQVLNSLGDEPAIRAARSEKIEAVPPAEEEAPGGEAGEAAPVTGPGEGAGTEEQAGLEDLLEGLSELPGETAEPAETPPRERRAAPAAKPAAEEVPGAPGEPEGLDFSSLFAQEGGAQPIEEIAPSAGPGAGAEQPPVPGAEEEFSFPEGEPPGLQSDLAQMESVPEEAEAPPSEPGAAEAGPFEDLGAFSFEAPETAAPGEGGEPEAAAPAAEPSGGESLELPDLEGLSFEEPTGAVEAPGPAGRGAAEIEAAPTGVEAPPREEAPAEGAFDLDTVTFPSEEAGPGELPSIEPGAGEAPFEAPAAEEPPGAEEPTIEIEGAGEEALGSLEEFALPESAQRFGVEQPVAKPAPVRPPPRAAPRAQAPAPRELVGPGEEAAGEIELTPEQFARLKQTLESLPRNLKIVVQDLVGEGTATGANLRSLIDLLVAGATAQEIAALAGRITGRRIRIPPGYEKKTGAAFEAEQRTFAYALRQNILPLVRVLAITLVFGALFGYLGYRYVYRPLAAIGAYRAGYSLIGVDEYALANDRFAAGVRIWPMKRWYFHYAEGFSAKRQYVLAEEKYEQLLAEFGYDKKALLDYASMESTKLADYEKADALLNRVLDTSAYDYDALLAAGDNDIEWAASQPGRYEAGRLAYATLLDRYGVKDELLFRMLRYFIRTDNGREIERLRAYYSGRPSIRVDASVYAELGGYLLDHRMLDNVQEVLFRADKVDPTLYDVHYSLARYYRIVGRQQDEKSALDHVVDLLKLTSSQALTRRRLSVEIDTHTRLGEWWYAQKGYIDAGNELRTAIGLIERNRGMNLLGKDRTFGRAYAAYGDLFYYIQGDLPAAEVQYQKAIDNLYTTPSLTYKVGVIQYERGDYKSAVTTFTMTESATAYPSGDETELPATPADAATAAATAAGQPPQNLLYALGNGFYKRGDYFAAQGSYLRLLSRLESRRATIGTLLPDSRPGDRTLLETIARVDNNLGVTMLRLGQRTGDQTKRSRALVYLTASTEIADSLARNLSSTQRSENRSIASLNMLGILHPTAEFEPQIDEQLPRDLSATSW